jgi:membrane associated rhomboid family serine protease
MSKLTESLIVFAVVFCLGRFAVNFGLMGESFGHALVKLGVSAAIFGVLVLLCLKWESARRK